MLEAYLVSALSQTRDDFLHYKKGLIDEDEWKRRLSSILGWFDAPFARAWLDYAESSFEPDLVNEIRNELSQKGLGHVKSLIERGKSEGQVS